MAKREFGNGQRDFAGERQNTLVVSDFVTRQPLRWAATCSRCGTQQVVAHAALTAGVARCANSACGKDAIREAIEDTPARVRRREEEAEAARKMYDAELQASKLAEAERALTETHRKVLATMRERVLAIADDEFQGDPALNGVSMTEKQATEFNREQAMRFHREYADAYLSDNNLNALGAYFKLNGVELVSVPIIKAAYDRLSALGILEPRPVVAKPASAPQPVAALPPEDHLKPEPVTYPGFDREGNPKNYSERELSRLSSDDMKRLGIVGTEHTREMRELMEHNTKYLQSIATTINGRRNA